MIVSSRRRLSGSQGLDLLFREKGVQEFLDHHPVFLGQGFHLLEHAHQFPVIKPCSGGILEGALHEVVAGDAEGIGNTLESIGRWKGILVKKK